MDPPKSNVADCRKALPVGKHVYDLILCDPPWPYNGMYEKKRVSGIVPPYAQMSITKIKDLPIKSLASPKGCYLLMWTPGPHLSNAVQIMKAWGFTYVTVFLYWRKVYANGEPRMGLGNYTRSCAEFLLLGRRGAVLRHLVGTCRTMSQELQAPIREHSRKPLDAMRLINAFFVKDAHKIELFARPDPEATDALLKGWDQWGLEIPTYFVRRIKA